MSSRIVLIVVVLLIATIDCAKVRERFKDVRADDTVRVAYWEKDVIHMVAPRNVLGKLWHQAVLGNTRGMK